MNPIEIKPAGTPELKEGSMTVGAKGETVIYVAQGPAIICVPVGDAGEVQFTVAQGQTLTIEVTGDCAVATYS